MRPSIVGTSILAPETGFGDADGNADLDVVAVAREERMLFDARGDVEVARRRALRAGVTLAGNTEPRSVLRAGGNVHRYGFRTRDAAIAMAGGAGILQLAFAAAARAGEIELHGAGHLRDLSRCRCIAGR